jgi:23S rRNA (guanosine2251-2'-O)-methyltransferase
MAESAIVVFNVRSVANVASIFRTAAAAGVAKIYLIGLTPGPLDRFGRRRKDFAKVSLGSENLVSWEQTSSFSALAKKLKKENYFLVGLEQSPKAIDYKKIKAKEKTAVIVGNEVNGLPENILNKCDAVAEIKMPGEKESLNVANALAIALFRILNI